MEKISINDLSKIKNELKGYRLTYNQEGIVKFVSNNDIKAPLLICNGAFILCLLVFKTLERCGETTTTIDKYFG